MRVGRSLKIKKEAGSLESGQNAKKEIFFPIYKILINGPFPFFVKLLVFYRLFDDVFFEAEGRAGIKIIIKGTPAYGIRKIEYENGEIDIKDYYRVPIFPVLPGHGINPVDAAAHEVFHRLKARKGKEYSFFDELRPLFPKDVLKKIETIEEHNGELSEMEKEEFEASMVAYMIRELLAETRGKKPPDL